MKSALTQFVLAFALFVGTSIAYHFWYTTLSAKSAEAAGLQNQIVAKESAVQQSVATRAILNTVAGQEAVMRGYFVSESNIVGFISDLEARGQALGGTVTVRSVSAGTEGGHPTLELALTVQGSFDSVMRTVGAIEYVPYDLTVSSLSLGVAGKQVWHADMTVVVGSFTGSTGGAAPAVSSASAAANSSATPPPSVTGAQPL